MKINFLQTDSDTFSKYLPAIRLKKDAETKSFSFYHYNNDINDIAILVKNQKRNTWKIISDVKYNFKDKIYFPDTLRNDINEWIGNIKIKDDWYFIIDAKYNKLLYDVTFKKPVHFFSSFPPKVEQNKLYLTVYEDFVDTENKCGVARLKQDNDYLISLASFRNRSKDLYCGDKPTDVGILYAYALISGSMGIPFKIYSYDSHIADYFTHSTPNADKILPAKLVHHNYDEEVFKILLDERKETDKLEELEKQNIEKESEKKEEEKNNEKKVMDLSLATRDSIKLSEILENGMDSIRGIFYRNVEIDLDLQTSIDIDAYLACIQDDFLVIYARNVDDRILSEELKKVKDYFNSDNILLAGNIIYTDLRSVDNFNF